MTRTDPDIAIVEAIEAALAARGVEARRAAGRHLREMLQAQPQGAAPGKRGRKRTHDRDFAVDSLIDIVGTDPDGLALKQSVLIRKLARRYRDLGQAVPGITWLKDRVADLEKRSRIQERTAREKFARSPEIRSTFDSAESFVTFCKTRDRLEEKWHRDKSLQNKFGAAADYVVAALVTP